MQPQVTSGRHLQRSSRTGIEWVPRAGATRDKREDDRLTGCSRYYCERCHAWSNAGRTVEIVEAPQILAITLERYSISGGRVRRQDGRFTFPLDELDLTELVCSQQGRRRTIYEPLAIIVHSGSVDSGHYHALVREDEGSDEGAETTRRWLAYDDSSVRAVRPYRQTALLLLLSGSKPANASCGTGRTLAQRRRQASTRLPVACRRIEPRLRLQDSAPPAASALPLSIPSYLQWG